MHGNSTASRSPSKQTAHSVLARSSSVPSLAWCSCWIWDADCCLECCSSSFAASSCSLRCCVSSSAPPGKVVQFRVCSYCASCGRATSSAFIGRVTGWDWRWEDVPYPLLVLQRSVGGSSSLITRAALGRETASWQVTTCREDVLPSSAIWFLHRGGGARWGELGCWGTWYDTILNPCKQLILGYLGNLF